MTSARRVPSKGTLRQAVSQIKKKGIILSTLDAVFVAGTSGRDLLELLLVAGSSVYGIILGYVYYAVGKIVGYSEKI